MKNGVINRAAWACIRPWLHGTAIDIFISRASRDSIAPRTCHTSLIRSHRFFPRGSRWTTRIHRRSRETDKETRRFCIVGLHSTLQVVGTESHCVRNNDILDRCYQFCCVSFRFVEFSWCFRDWDRPCRKRGIRFQSVILRRYDCTRIWLIFDKTRARVSQELTGRTSGRFMDVFTCSGNFPRRIEVEYTPRESIKNGGVMI